MFENLLKKFKDDDYVYITEGILYNCASLKPISQESCFKSQENEWGKISGFVRDLKKIANEEDLKLYQASDKTKLIEILMGEDIVKSIKDNMDVLLNIIPEIKDMVNFPHNHPHHHLDVWNHTLLALSLSEPNFDIRLCLLLHDIGKPHSYQDKEIRHFKGHPLKSSEISRNVLNRLGYEENYINEICYLIKNHGNLIRKEDIDTNYKITLKRFLIQYCDDLAHNPNKLEKRIKYLKDTLELLKQKEPKIKERVKTKVKYNIY